jgi:predicted metal-binding membrane protein
MRATPALENLLRHDRLIVAAMLGSIVLPAWGYMAYEAHAMYHTGAGCCAGMAMAGPDANPWSAATLPPLFLMWAEMMVAMMIPSAAPMILTFAMVNRKRREQQRPFVPTMIFLSGYLAVWAGFSALAAVAQWILHARALLSPLMTSTSPVLGGILLLGAGIFQWTSLKNACLTHCRSPLGFLMTDWREGRQGALVMGLKHGVFCAGCCWLLMILLFVAGVMNLWWIAILTVFVLLEKVAPRGWPVGKVAGVLLALWGIWLLIRPH